MESVAPMKVVVMESVNQEKKIVYLVLMIVVVEMLKSVKMGRAKRRIPVVMEHVKVVSRLVQLVSKIVAVKKVNCAIMAHVHHKHHVEMELVKEG